MKTTQDQVERILRTLPIGYYGTKALVALDMEADTSRVNPMTREIRVAFANVLDYVAGLPETSGPEEVETAIRCSLYHELSHLLLSPLDVFNLTWGVHYRAGISMEEAKDVCNIIEDERIETLLRTYYHGVNFRENIKRISGYEPGRKAGSPKQYLFQICRYREGPADLVAEMDNISGTLNGAIATPAETDLASLLYASFYNKVRERFEEERKAEAEKPEGGENPEEPKESESGESGENGEPEEGEASGNAEESDSKREIEEGEESEESEESKISAANLEAAKNRLAAMLSAQTDPAIDSNVRKLVLQAAKRRALDSGIRRGYAGRMDPKAVAKRDDYRWWTRQGKDESGKGSRLHLRLLVDRSGSFGESMPKINALVSSLLKMEREMPDVFCFDVLETGMETKVHDKKTELEAMGGNDFFGGVAESFAATERKGWRTVTVAVWDGFMSSERHFRRGNKIHSLKELERRAAGIVKQDMEAYKVLDNRETVIVSDSTNKAILDLGAKNARRIYLPSGSEYAEAFIGEVLKELGRIL